MEVNGCLKMIPIPKSIGHLDNGLDLGIDPFTDSIGYSMPKVSSRWQTGVYKKHSSGFLMGTRVKV